MATIPIGTFSEQVEVVPGKIVTHLEDENIRSFAAEGTLVFGQAAMQGTLINQADTYEGASGVFLGVIAYDPSAGSVDDSSYDDTNSAGICNAGIIKVVVEEPITIGDPVRVRHTAGTGAQIPGNFATTADAGATTLLTQCEWRETVAVSGSCTLYLHPVFTETDD